MMKKIILFSVICASSIISLFGQDNDVRERIQLGIKFGANFSNVFDEEGQEFIADSKFGLAGGLFLRIPLGTYVGFQPEIMFSQKGFTATGKMFSTNYSLTRTSNFIDVPLLLAIKPFSFLTIVAGPQYSYLIKQTNTFESGGSTVLQEKEFENDNIRKNILCVTTGVDVNIEHFVVGARAGWDFQNNNGNGISETPRYKNAWYQLTVGYRIY
jgi:hypothetical protein